MAAPPVSRLIASFLSKRLEFTGRPDDVKRILLQHCTDLGRQRNMQGAGMPNLVKMLVNVKGPHSCDPNTQLHRRHWR